MDTETQIVNENEERRQLWRGHLDRQSRSGKTIKAYCAENGVKPWNFFYWRKALAPKEVEGGFLELATGPRAGMTLAIGGCTIGVERGFDPTLLREIVAALRPG